jgi:hypothetical protein
MLVRWGRVVTNGFEYFTRFDCWANVRSKHRSIMLVIQLTRWCLFYEGARSNI